MTNLDKKSNYQRPLQVEKGIKVCTYDIDFAGIVSNIVYIRWLEDLRLLFLDKYLPLENQFSDGYLPIMAGTEIEYKYPIKIFDHVRGNIWIGNLSKVKWVLQAEIIANNRVAAIATQKGAFIDAKTNRPIPIPEILHQQYLHACSE